MKRNKKGQLNSEPRPERRNGIFIKCKNCNKDFYISKSRIGKKFFCCKKCYAISKIGVVTPMKGRHHSDETKLRISLSKLGTKASKETRLKLSKSLLKLNRKGKKSQSWKGGKIYTQKGYILIYNIYHPFASKKHYVLEHRLVVEKHIKRYLAQDEIIHHINRKKDDNRIENLYLFSASSKHSQAHMLNNLPKKSNLIL